VNAGLIYSYDPWIGRLKKLGFDGLNLLPAL
jgi:hypothetical protein